MPYPQALHPLHIVGAEEHQRRRETLDVVGVCGTARVGFPYNEIKLAR